ncbi:MAG TPA: cobalamin-dependent protein, partial [Bacillota bacterium]|nr:cobalamin-dependent protein [Bacillota bacterium]
MKEMAKRSEATPKTMAAASIGDCIHVAGIFNFFKLAESAGWETQFIGSAKSPEEIAIWTRENRPHVLAIGYRLDPSAARRLIERLVKALDEHGVNPKPRLIFGGTPPVAEVARASGVFEKVFSGEEDISETMAYLRGESGTVLEETTYPSSLIDRIKWKSPYPIIRHHFGLPSLDETISGIE